jgi:hypothetical protein
VRRPLISPENSFWRNALGVVAAAVIVPLAVIAKLLTMPFERPVRRTPADVVRYLRDFIERTGGDWDRDDFEHIPIANPALDSIRDRASRVTEPVGEDGMTTLRGFARRGRGAGARGKRGT